MNKASQTIVACEIVGSTSIASPENVFRSPRQKMDSSFYVSRNQERHETRALKTIEKMTGGPRRSYEVKLGGDKMNYSQRTKAPSSAILVRPGEHIPQDFYAPDWVEHSERMKEWEQIRASKSSLLMWFEMTAEGKASKAIVDRLAEQLEASRDQIREMAALGDLVSEEDYSKAVQAANNNADHLKAAEQAHFEKGSAKHLLAKPKDSAKKGNTAKVVSSVLDVMIKPGEHIAARQTPAELRKITTDKNGNITGKPSADRVKIDGHVSLVEPIEVTAEEIAADKKESAKHAIQKTKDGLAEIRTAEDRVDFLRGQVEYLKAQGAEHGHSRQSRNELDELTKQLKAAQTRLANKLEPVKAAVQAGKVKLSGCQKHAGRTNCPCQREKYTVTEVDGKRGIVRRDRKVA